MCRLARSKSGMVPPLFPSSDLQTVPSPGSLRLLRPHGKPVNDLADGMNAIAGGNGNRHGACGAGRHHLAGAFPDVGPATGPFVERHLQRVIDGLRRTVEIVRIGQKRPSAPSPRP